MKEQDKTSEEQLRRVEIGNLLKKELRIMIVEMIHDIRIRMGALTKKIQENINSTINDAEEQISELKDRWVEITVMEQNKE